MNQRVIAVVPYQPQWSETFVAEQLLLQQALGTVAIAIHHIGSTAVPDLAAKPIIDILLEVSSLAELDNLTPQLLLLGYSTKGENGITGRRYFYKTAPQSSPGTPSQRSHHLHAFATDDPHLKRHLAFRDYLIKYPARAAEYQALKIAAAERCKDQHNSSVFYTGLKSSFIEYHTGLALQCDQAE